MGKPYCGPASLTRAILFHAIVVVALYLGLLTAPARGEEEASLLGLSAVLGDLQRGGLVVYLRHASTDRSQSDAGADLSRCETQRNLSDKGRAQAKRIGKAFRSLKIPIGKVFSSPFCRCRDTAQLAFGRYTVDQNLFFAVSATKAEVKRMTEWLRETLSTRPADGTNTVIVSHTANLREAAGIWPKPEAVTIVFRPGGNGDFEAIARIPPDEWPMAAKASSQQPTQ